MEKTRGFEVARGFEDKQINLPILKMLGYILVEDVNVAMVLLIGKLLY